MASEQSWQIKMLYDGKCPLCSREASFLKRRDLKSQIAFEDISDPNFDADRYGLSLPTLIASMHAIRPDGTVLSGVDVFAELYDIVGLPWLSRPLRWRWTRPFAVIGYRLFARIRPLLSGFRPESCESDRCVRPPK